MDVGPGDVVEHLVTKGRHVVHRIGAEASRCTRGIDACGLVSVPFYHATCPDIPRCPHHWRKIGGSQADTVRRFAEDLTTTPEVVVA